MNIELTDQDKRKAINSPTALYGIMQRILLRENEIDQEKEHFWVIGLNMAGYILYIELVTLGSVKEAHIEPMNVYRVAVMKNAVRVIAVHNHPSGSLAVSDADKDITDRLIQVGKILNIELEDHVVITPAEFVSFRTLGLMDQLENSIKYVPTYQIIEKIRKEEQKIAKSVMQTVVQEKDEAIKIERERREKLERTLVSSLLAKNIPVEEIAKILEITPKDIQKMIEKLSTP